MTTPVAPFPVLRAVLDEHGRGHLDLNGRQEPISAATTDEARRAVLQAVADYTTRSLNGRPVRLQVEDPSGKWLLAVHADGATTELGGTPAPAPRRTRRTRQPSQSSSRPSWLPRVAAVAVLLLGAGALATTLLNTSPDTPPAEAIAAPQPAPTTPDLRALVTEIAQAAHANAQKAAEADRAAKAAAAKRAAAKKRAEARRKKAAAAKKRAAKERAAAASAPAPAVRAAPAQPASPPRVSSPQPAPAAPSCNFPPC